MIVDVIQCKECIYHQMRGCMNKEVTEFWKYRSIEDYCSKGVKKEEQNE